MLESPVLSMIGDRFAEAIVAAVLQQYPNAPRHVMRDDDDRPIPREVHPAFYGCFDWHSAVEMHWALVVLLQAAQDATWAASVRGVLDRHLTPENLRTEAAYLAANPAYERPYGWGWTLQLAEELAGWDDPDAQRWSAAIRPLADTVSTGLLTWLPKPAYPDRSGAHANTAFALARALPWAIRTSDGLVQTIRDAAQRWYADNVDYPFRYEPSGADFLSAGLAEAELMHAVLDTEAFARWWAAFSADVDAVTTPALVTDPEDGQGAHLIGLNLHRAYVLRMLGRDDAAQRHLDESLPSVTGAGWMAEHWLATYAVLATR